jgi:phage terminase Nu1 subunit (DNA packaging protein)
MIHDSQSPNQGAAAMSQREYARHRGVSQAAVSRAISQGRLVKSVNARGSIVDPALADREWDAATDLSKAPSYVRERAAGRAGSTGGAPPGAPNSSGTPGTLAENNAAKAYWQARQAELDYREAAGELVPAAEVEREWADILSRVRTKLLAVPSRAKAELPHLDVADIAKLERLVREALEDLSSPAEEES